MAAKKEVVPAVKTVVRRSIRNKIVDVIESTDVLDDNDIALILNSLLENGWKTEDGKWRSVT